MTEIQNPKLVLVIEYWDLRFIWVLMLGIWDFAIVSHEISKKLIRKFLNCCRIPNPKTSFVGDKIYVKQIGNLVQSGDFR